jgi:hypothetical protein
VILLEKLANNFDMRSLAARQRELRKDVDNAILMLRSQWNLIMKESSISNLATSVSKNYKLYCREK